ncbi:hypothetical protein HaLaN_16596, partial [Haematococcus lacustris]
MSHPHCQQ